MHNKLVEHWVFLSLAEGKKAEKRPLEELAKMAVTFLEGKI